MTVLVVNPNSSTEVTAALRDAVGASGAVVTQLDDAPPEITRPEHHDMVVPLVLAHLDAATDAYAAVVLACHGDPGLSPARARFPRPVFGIGESSLHAAAASADRFGVLTLGPELVDRKWSQVRAAGLAQRCVAVEPTGTSVRHALRPEADLTPYRQAATRALEVGAGALVLGCAGMVTLADQLRAEFGIPIIEPVTVTFALAQATVNDRSRQENQHRVR